MIFLLTPITLILIFYLIGNLFSKLLNLENTEKPIVALGFIILVLNYGYFNLNLKIEIIFYFLSVLALAAIIFTIKSTNFDIKNYKFLIHIFIVLIPLSLIGIIYGEQYYVFRGNIYDHFVYLSSGLSFFNYDYNELLKLSIDGVKQSNNEFYLSHILNVINSRPSAQLFLSFLINLKFIDVIEINYIFKLIIFGLTFLSSYNLFYFIIKNREKSLLISITFIFSFFYFYNHEIDAHSLLLSLPFFFLIIKYTIELKESLYNFNNIFFAKFILVASIYFIVYPNGGAIVAIPIFIYFIYMILKYKIDYLRLKKIIVFILIFILLILPTYKTTIMYLINSEIPVGFSHKVDFWGYYGAFIFGKDNPVHNLEVVNQIKEMWASGNSLFNISLAAIKANIETGNIFFFLNIIPSIFGFYHFTTSDDYGIFNYFLFVFLIFLNFIIIKIYFKNVYFIFTRNNNLNLILRIFLFYFIIFFLFLVLKNQIWSAIKLYFILSPIFFIMLILDLSKDKLMITKKYILFLLMLLPIYKYSQFNNGIGVLDSFPSIINKDSKIYTQWSVDRSKLENCKSLKYDLNDKFHKIYISLLFNHKKEKNYERICKISLEKDKFVLQYIE